MNNHSLSEIENSFFNHCANHGVIFTNRPLIADGLLQRAYVEGDKRGTKNGAYILYADNKPSGWFQYWKSGLSGTWTLSGKREPMTAVMRQQIEADRQRRKVEQQERHKDAADKARFIWFRASSIVKQSDHPYLVTKRIQPHILRLHRDCLVVPIYNERRELVNLQFIQADGTKRFLTGGQKKGCFSTLGVISDDGIIPICEGWATGASLYETSGNFTVMAMDAGNLEPVALVFRRLYPSHQIVICGDNDLDGKGQKAARAAALAVTGKYLIPAIAGHDWNDVLTREVAQ